MGELERLGIYVGNRTGTFRTLCPQCSHTRKNKRDRCLSVSVQSRRHKTLQLLAL
jgi:hypothetical protein